MFCPKCGTKNPDDGKFCRKCGTELAVVAEALSGVSSKHVARKTGSKKSKVNWESAFGKLFSGFAFLAVSIILGATGAAGASSWWFWMLIPAFAMMGAGFAQVMQLRSTPSPALGIGHLRSELPEHESKALPQSQTDYVQPESAENFETGDLVPPSVVEDTTRHLEIEKEAKTMTLPEKD